MKKLCDQQVMTLMFILLCSPKKPKDMSRFPTLQMFLDENIIWEGASGFLYINFDNDTIAYQYVMPDHPSLREMQQIANDGAGTFEEQEAASHMVFAPSADPKDIPGASFFFHDLFQFREKVIKLGGLYDADKPLNYEEEPVAKLLADEIKELKAKYPFLDPTYSAIQGLDHEAGSITKGD